METTTTTTTRETDLLGVFIKTAEGHVAAEMIASLFGGAHEYDAKMLALGETDEEAIEVWAVMRDGTSTPALISGYTGDERGLVAMHFAQDDLAGWREDGYDEVLWVRRCRPVPEAEPGQAFRVTVARDPDAEREWAEDERGDDAVGGAS